MQLILETVCEFYGMKPNLLFSVSKKRYIVERRMIFFYLCKLYSSASLAQQVYFATANGRIIPIDHSTIMHSRKTIENLILLNVRIKNEISEMHEIIKEASLCLTATGLIISDVNLVSVCEKNARDKIIAMKGVLA